MKTLILILTLLFPTVEKYPQNKSLIVPVKNLTPITALPISDNPTLSILFSPNGGCQSVWVATLDGAKKVVRIQIYSFTAQPIADAIIRAKKRGVNIQIVADPSSMNTPALLSVISGGVPVYVDSSHAIMHSKVGIVDGKTVLTGSYNLSDSAEFRNAENLVVITSRKAADIYTKEWEKHKIHSSLIKQGKAVGQFEVLIKINQNEL